MNISVSLRCVCHVRGGLGQRGQRVVWPPAAEAECQARTALDPHQGLASCESRYHLSICSQDLLRRVEHCPPAHAVCTHIPIEKHLHNCFTPPRSALPPLLRPAASHTFAAAPSRSPPPLPAPTVAPYSIPAPPATPTPATPSPRPAPPLYIRRPPPHPLFSYPPHSVATTHSAPDTA